MNEEDIQELEKKDVKTWEAELRVMMDNYLKFGRGEHHVHTIWIEV